MPTKSTGPWYSNFDYWSSLAEKYIRSYRKIPKDAPHHAELNSFNEFTAYQLVFESNLIEHAGLPRRETRKVIQEHFPHLPNSYEAMRRVHAIGKDQIVSLIESGGIEEALDYSEIVDDLVPSISFANKSRKIMEVICHLMALYRIQLVVIDFIVTLLRERSGELEKHKHRLEKARDNYEATGQFSKDLVLDVNSRTLTKKILSTKGRVPDLFTEDRIKELHQIIAEGLLPADAGVAAGEYRVDSRMFGEHEIVFPSPELIPECMREFVAKANSQFLSHFIEDTNMFENVAVITYDFVRIHPFPDFNGRLSRLLLVMILQAYKVPFAVTLRGDKKGRDRYFKSLKRANGGNIAPYAALIAMRVAETFQEIDQNLALAGLPSILTFDPEE